jgi:hypothetical protein
MKTFSHSRQYLVEFFLEWEMCEIKVVEKIRSHILCSATPPPPRKPYHLWDNVMYGGDREDADNMAPARGMLDK